MLYGRRGKINRAIENGWRYANQGAVPGTGKIKASFRTFYRQPSSLAIFRAILAATGSLKGEKVPPTAWDDIGRADVRDRTWKRHRRTQWRNA